MSHVYIKNEEGLVDPHPATEEWQQGDCFRSVFKNERDILSRRRRE
jgi:hypothetical protein